MEIIAIIHRRQNLTHVFTSTVFSHLVNVTPSSPSVILDQQQNQKVFYICSLLWLRQQKKKQFVSIFLGRIN